MILHARALSSDEAGADRPVRLGLAVGRRFGGAVVRNRLRRLLREACRAEVGELVGRWDLVLAPRPEAVEASLWELRQELRALLREAGVIPAQGGGRPR